MFPEKQLPRLLAGDTETDLIGPGNLAPKLICSSFAWRHPSTPDQVSQLLLGNTPEELERLHLLLKTALEDDDLLFIGHQMSYDMGVWWRQFPDLGPLIFRAYSKLRIYDTKQAERMRNVSKHGQISFKVMPDESTRPVKYHLDDLGQKYLGKTRTAEKMDPGAWRLNYIKLDGMHADSYPAAAKKYALEDAYDTLLVAERQHEEGLKTPDYDSIVTARMRSWTEFSYHLCSIRGMQNNPEKCKRLSDEAERIANWENCPHMVAAGFLVPPEPPRPYGNGAKNPDGSPMMTKGDPKEHEKTKLLALYVLLKVLHLQLEVDLTDTGIKLFGKKSMDHQEILDFLFAPEISSTATDKFKKVFIEGADKLNTRKWTEDEERSLELWEGYDRRRLWLFASYISMTAAFLLKLSVMMDDPILAEYERRKSVAKLRTTVFPNILGHSLVHTSYDFPKKTMRGSSRISSLFPSLPAQQMPGELGGIDPRPMIEARDGYAFVDSDYNSLELCSLAQVTYSLFKGTGVECAHRDKINQGYDLHSFLGSGLARVRSPEIQSWYREQRAETRDEQYLAFKQLAVQGDDGKKLYKHWRTFAKPVGLGYPGRLGPKTMVEFAAATYRIRMTLEEAQMFRAEWLGTYPEMEVFFKYLHSMRDARNPVLGTTRDGKSIEGYAYQSPLGSWRRGCKMTDVSNGMTMQTPSAEGFHLALNYVQRACYDPSVGNILFGGGVLIPFHDQLLVEVPMPTLEHARACAAEIDRLMVFGMRQVCPDVSIRTETVLCSAWSKKAEPLLDHEGKLLVWHPQPIEFEHEIREVQVA